MSAIDDPKTLGRARLSFADQHDIDEFIATLEKFERGEISPDEWRAFRATPRLADVDGYSGAVGRRVCGEAPAASWLAARPEPVH